MTQLFSPLVERAMRVAAHWHRHHERKVSRVPYLMHPASVALLLVRAGFDDDETLAAALLHDAIEDTSYTAEQLAAEFPPRVARYVAALTERKRDANGRKRSWEERKCEHLDQIVEAPVEARAIVLADKLHNLGAMLFDLENGEPLWESFHAAPERVVWYHRSMIERAAADEGRLASLAEACRGLLARLEATLAAASAEANPAGAEQGS